MDKTLKNIIATVVLATIIIIYGLAGLTDIDPGETGILIKKIGANKGMQKETWDTGLHWVDPISHDVAVYDVRCRQLNEGIRGIQGDTKDGQKVEVDVSLEICLEDEKVPYLHEKVGRAWYAKLVHPAARTIIRKSTSSEPSDNIYTAIGRGSVEKLITTQLNSRFQTDYGINITANLRDITFLDEDFKNTLTRKAKEAQNVIIAEREALKAEQNAIRVANVAEGEKQKVIKEAEAEAAKLRLQGVGIRQKKVQVAKGILAVKKAEAEGARLLTRAYAGPGAKYVAQIEWAKNLGPNVKVWGVPTGAPGTSSIVDLNGVMNNAFTGKGPNVTLSPKAK